MHPISRLAAVLAALLLSACASTPATKTAAVDESAATTKGEPSTDVLAERAIARWEDLIARRAEDAWNYLSPGYRATNPQAAYAKTMNERPVQWYKVERYVVSEGEEPAIECVQPRSCTIKLKVHFKVASNLTGVGMLDSWNVLKEHWVNVRDQWYLVPEDVVR